MGDNLQDKPRKELKELCSQNNIRTAGVKHEDLVRLLRNKLYPSAPQTPRSPKARGPNSKSPLQDSGESYKTPVKTSGKGRNIRTLPRQNESPQEVTSVRRKNSGLSRKPLLTKSNTFTSRRTDLRTKAAGVDQDAQENVLLHQNSVRRLCLVNGLSPLSRKSAEAPGQRQTGSKGSSIRSVGEFKDGAMAQTDLNARTEGLTSPQASEGDAHGTAVEPSDAGSDASRRVSEIATDAGPDTMSDFSDADEFRSVSSEPISRFSSLGKRLSLRTESSKLSFSSAQSGLSFLSAGSWGSDSSRTLDNLLASVEGNDSGRGDVTEDIFPEFPEGSDFLVGDADALELSYLDAGGADPEVIVNGKDHAVPVDRFDAMDSPMARDYVNYNRGSETDISENVAGSSGISIAELTSAQGKKFRDVNMADVDAAGTSANAVEKYWDSTVASRAEDAVSEELGRFNDESVPEVDLAPDNEANKSKRSSSGDIAKEDSIAAARVPHDPSLDAGDIGSRSNRISRTNDDDFLVNDVLRDESQPIELKSTGISSETSSGLEHSEREACVVDTPTQSGSCAREDGTTSISNGVMCSEGHSAHVEPNSKDIEDEAEVHGNIPEDKASSIYDSPTSDSRDYSGAKKLDFEPVQITQLASLPHAEHDAKDEEADGRNFQNLEESAIRVPEPIEDDDSALHSNISCLDEPTMNSEHGGKAEVVSETLPPTIQNASSDVDHDEYESGQRAVEQDKSRISDREDDTSSEEALGAPVVLCKDDDVATPLASHQQEGETAGIVVSPRDIDSSEAEDLVVSTAEGIERHSNVDNESLPLPRIDTPPVTLRSVNHPDSSPTNSSDGNTAPELDRSSCLTDEQEGSDVKSRNGQCASTFGASHDYNKDGREKEVAPSKLSFPLSAILWCSQLCSPISGNRNQSQRF